MSKTSSAVKNRYNKKSYDYINFTVKKGDKELLKTAAAQENLSLNAFIRRAVYEAAKLELK